MSHHSTRKHATTAMHLTDPTPQSRRNWILGILGTTGLGAVFIQLALSKAAHESARVTKARESEAVLQRAANEEAVRLQRQQAEERSRRDKHNQALQKLSQKASDLLEQAQSADAGSVDTIRAAFVEQVEELHCEAMAQTKEVSQALSNWRNVVALGLMLAKDRIKHTEDTASHMRSCLEPVTTPMVSLTGATQCALEKLRHELNDHSNQLSTQLLADAGAIDAEFQRDLDGLQAGLQSQAASIQKDQLELMGALLTAPLDAVGFIAFMQLLKSAFEKVVQRAASTAAANIALLTIDGPLPFGKAFAMAADIGFALWTVRDIQKLSRELPGKIEAHLRDELNTQRDKALAAFDAQAVQWLCAADEKRRTALDPVLDPKNS